MASILDRYGIKEVCDFTFYELGSDGKPTKPVLFLDTLKVSTVEQTGEQVDSRGGKGNVILASWDTNKEINVTIEDALFSAKSMAIMFGNGTVKSYASESGGKTAYIMKTEQFISSGTTVPVEGTSSGGWDCKFTGPDGSTYTKKNPKFYDAYGNVVKNTPSTGDLEPGEIAWAADQTYFCTFDIEVSGGIIEISANSFPGTYYCVGDTYARNASSGKDEFFQFIIPKAKVQAENTITLEADGDPSTFNMSLKVMRPDDGVMMKLVKYDAVGGTAAAAEGLTGTVIHNHELLPKTAEANG